MKKLFLRPIVSLLVVVFIFFSCNSSTSVRDNEDDKLTQELCEDTYPCNNIDLIASLTPSELLGERLSDIWGWTDPVTGKEYALVAMTDRVTFVDISSPSEPIVVGSLPESISNKSNSSSSMLHDDDDEGKSSAWRDIKVYNNHAFIVSDGQPHGLQVFDLKRLRNVQSPPTTFTEDLHYTEFGNAHNIAINEETGFAYVVGSNQVGGGLYILNIQDPLNPEFVGSHSDNSVGINGTGYVHDTQCVIYSGPDMDYKGNEICFNSSETHMVIADVTEKSGTFTIGKSSYSGNEYAHQGWLTEDQRYFLLDDELDEPRRGINTTTYIWDVSDLDNPTLMGTYDSEFTSIDHNQYVKGDYSFQANYTTGLRILDISDIASGNLTEVAYFDTYPADNEVKFDGAWSNYPFFDNGLVIVSDMSNGLFILSPSVQ